MTDSDVRKADLSGMTQGWPVEDRVGQILEQVLDLTGAERDAFVRAVCADDPALLAEINELLAMEIADEDGFLARSPAVRVDSARPKAIGPFEVLSLLGEGGMGSVYLALQRVPIERTIAIKVLRPFQHADSLQRIAAESQSLARLSHPNICALHEVRDYVDPSHGDTLCLVMEWVDGEQIGEWCDNRRLSLRERLRLFRGACDGIRHAHEKGVLHCDIKPSNLLVTATGGEPTVKVIDFGIARALDDSGGAQREPGPTIALGSPMYISPEALITGGRQRMDTRSDVYSLGLVLYELLTGTLPVERSSNKFKALAPDAQMRDYAAPSVRYAGVDESAQAEVAEQRSTAPAALRRNLRGDLDAIVLKAIAADPAQRYGSPTELWSDIDAYLTRRPVSARAGSTAYLVSRFVRRHLPAVAVASALIVAVAGGLVARTLEAQRADAEARRAVIALEQSEQVQDFLVSLFDAADPDRSEGPTSLQRLLDEGAARVDDELAGQPLVRARLLHVLSRVYTKLGQLEPALQLAQESVDIYRSEGAESDQLAIESRLQLGTILRQLGKSAEAESVLLEAMDQLGLSLDAKPGMLAALHNSLGNLYWRLQRYDEAEQHHRNALAIRVQDPNAGRKVADSANNLGVILLTQLRHAEAEEMLLKAAEIYAQTVGPDHPLLAGNLNNRGMIVRNSPRWAEALALFVEATEIMQRHYGAAHPRTLSSRRNALLDRIWLRRWDIVEREVAAMEPLFDSLNIPRQKALFATNKAKALLAADRPAEARELLIRARDLFDLDLDHTDATLRDLDVSLARAEARTGSLDAALARLDRLAEQLQHLPPFNKARAFVARNHGELLIQAGRFSEAETELQAALRIYQNDPRKSVQLNAITQRQLAILYLRIGDRPEALKFATRSLALLVQMYGPDHRSVATTQLTLGEILQASGDLPAARHALADAVRIRETIYPSGNSETAAARAKLAAVERP